MWRNAVRAIGLSSALLIGCDDDDGDGGGASTTTLAGASTTTLAVGTTTTFGGVTSTSTGGVVEPCELTWSVTNAATLGALQFDTDYSAAPGGIEGAGDAVVCTDVTGSLASFNDNEGTQVLSAGFISIAGFTTPRDVMRCNYVSEIAATRGPRVEDFVITVVDAADPSLNPVTANVEITSFDCGFGNTTLPTVTTSTTTTTLGTPFTVAFNVDDAVTIGGLQLEIDYSDAGGTFDGSADAVACTNLSGSELSSFHDHDAQQKLALGFVDAQGVTGPLSLAECSFRAHPGGTPTAADFIVNTIDVTAPDLTPITPAPAIGVVVTEVTTTSTTTTSITLDPSFQIVAFTMEDPVTIGALQFDVDYSQAHGSFVGTGADVRCLDRTRSLHGFNDQDESSKLTAGFVAPENGFTGPRLLMECSFDSTAGDPAPEDFAVSVVDATDPFLSPINPRPTIAVSVEP